MRLFIILISFLYYQIMLKAQPGNGFENTNQTSLSITGHIIDQNTKQPIEYAQVTIFRSKDTSLVNGTITDTSGMFTMKNISMGRYFIEVGFLGYKKTRINNIIAKPNQTNFSIGDVMLEPLSTQLAEVNVTGQKSNMEYRIDKKVVNVASNLNSIGATAIEALENVPSIQTTIEGDLTLRGSSSFTVLIDGKPSLIGGSDALKQIPASSIDRIEVITNPSAKYEAEGSAGIINVIMKKDFSTGTNGIVNITGGSTLRDIDQSTLSGNFTVNVRKNKVNYFINGDYMDGSNFLSTEHIQTTFSNIGKTDTNSYYRSIGEGLMARDGASFRSGIDYTINDYQSISISGVYEQSQFRRVNESNYLKDTSVITPIFFYQNNSNIKRKNENFRINLDHTFQISEGHELVSNLFYGANVGKLTTSNDQKSTDQNWNPVNDDLIWKSRILEESDGYIGQFKTDYTWEIDPKTRFESGIQANVNSSSNSNIETLMDIELSELEYQFRDNIYGGYLTFSQSTPWFDYQAGIRPEYSDRLIEPTDTSFKLQKMDWFPSIHLSKKFAWDIETQLSFSRRLNRPRAMDLVPTSVKVDKELIRTGNPGLEPEYENAYELSIRKPFMQVAFISLEIFQKTRFGKVERIEQYDPVLKATIYKPENINKEIRTGMETMLNMPLARWINLNGTFSLYRYELIDNRFNTNDKEQYNWETRWTTGFRFKTGTMAQFTFMYESKEIEPQGYDLPNYMALLGIRQEVLDKKGTIAIQVRDLFQTARRDSRTFADNFNSERNYHMISPMFTTTFTYRINNYERKSNQRQREDMNQIDFNGF